MKPDEAGAAVAELVAKLHKTGLDLPTAPMLRGAREVAAAAGAASLASRVPVSIKVAEHSRGVSVVLSGRGARLSAGRVRRDLLRRLPEIRTAVGAELRRRLR